jgi:hypothetical protein
MDFEISVVFKFTYQILLELLHIVVIGNELPSFPVEIVAGPDKVPGLLVCEFIPWVVQPTFSYFCVLLVPSGLFGFVTAASQTVVT